MIWLLDNDVNNYQQLGLLHMEKDWEIPTYSFNGTSLIDQWSPLDVFIENPQYLPGDFPSMTGIPLVVTERSFSPLRPLIGDYVEFLPLNCIDCDLKELYAVNVLTMLDCLDHARSEIEYFSEGRVSFVSQYVFKPNCIGDTPIFKIPELKLSRTFVNDEFKELVERHRLKGLMFKPVSKMTE